MKSLNNTQRMGLVRMLEKALKELETNQSSYFQSFGKYTDLKEINDWSDSDRKKLLLALLKKSNLQQMKEQEKELERKIEKEISRIQGMLNSLEVREEQIKKEKIKSLKLAIRDLWTEQDADEAKKLVAKFIELK